MKVDRIPLIQTEKQTGFEEQEGDLSDFGKTPGWLEELGVDGSASPLDGRDPPPFDSGFPFGDHDDGLGFRGNDLPGGGFGGVDISPSDLGDVANWFNSGGIGFSGKFDHSGITEFQIGLGVGHGGYNGGVGFKTGENGGFGAAGGKSGESFDVYSLHEVLDLTGGKKSSSGSSGSSGSKGSSGGTDESGDTKKDSKPTLYNDVGPAPEKRNEEPSETSDSDRAVAKNDDDDDDGKGTSQPRDPNESSGKISGNVKIDPVEFAEKTHWFIQHGGVAYDVGGDLGGRPNTVEDEQGKSGYDPSRHQANAILTADVGGKVGYDVAGDLGGRPHTIGTKKFIG